MLTVKIIVPDGNKTKPEDFLTNIDFREWIEEATSVALNTAAQSQTGHRSVTYFTDDGRPQEVFEGTIYVMNENGNTIARYDLGYGNYWQKDNGDVPLINSNDETGKE